MKIKLFFLVSCIVMQGCSKLDDYLLGKDNTPTPRELKEIQDKVKVSQNWAVSVGQSSKNKEYLRLQPVVQAGIIYTADASGLIQAVDRNNGRIKWTTRLKPGLISGPTVANGFIALSANNSSLIVLNQTDGKKLWQARVSSEILSPPTINSNKVIVKTIDGRVYAFNSVEGKQIWMAEHGSPSLILKASSSPIIMDNLVLIGFSDGKLDALDIETGRIIWERSIAYASGSSDVERLVDIGADPIVENNIVYLASYQGYIGALSLADGQFIWRKPGSVYKNMTLSGPTLYVTDSHDVLWSIDKHTGQVNWKQTALKARLLTEPALVKKDLVVADKSGYLHFIDSQTGEILARSKITGGISISPKVIGSKLYVLTDDGMLHQLSVS